MLKRLLIMLLLSGLAYGTGVAVTPFSNGKPQFFNGNTVCNGCLLYTYAAGTTTPQNTYTDSTGTVPNANPIVLDSNGMASIWLQALSYKYVLNTAAGSLIWSMDVVNPFNFQPAFTPPVSITDSTSSETALSLTASGASGTALSLTNSGTNSTGLSINTSSAGPAIFVFGGVGIQGPIFTGSSRMTLGGTNAPFSISLNGSGTVANFTNLATGNIADFINNTAARVLRISQTGITINGGTEITGQTGTGGTVVMSAAPAITGNMTYASTTPIANLTGQILAYSIAGAQQPSYHAVVGSCTLGTNCGITLTNAAVYTAAGTYFCWATDVTAAAAVRIQYTSGSAFTLTGTGTDALSFGCIGN